MNDYGYKQWDASNPLKTLFIRLFVGSKRRPRENNCRFYRAGILPGSVRTRYDLLGTSVRGRLQYA